MNYADLLRETNSIETLQDVLVFFEKGIKYKMQEFYNYINNHTGQEWRNEHGDNLAYLLPNYDLLESMLMMKMLVSGVDVKNLDKLNLKNNQNEQNS